MTRLKRSHQELTIEETAAFYEDSLEAIRLLKQKVIHGEYPIPERFIGLTLIEVEEIFEAREIEIEHNAMFNLLAATEASLKIDFFERVNKKGKNELSSKFYGTYRTEKGKISLEKHIIEEWKEFKPELRYVFSNFKGLLNYRHWLAHGRYWIPDLSRKKNDFDSIYQICSEVEKVLIDNR